LLTCSTMKPIARAVLLISLSLSLACGSSSPSKVDGGGDAGADAGGHAGHAEAGAGDAGGGGTGGTGGATVTHDGGGDALPNDASDSHPTDADASPADASDGPDGAGATDGPVGTLQAGASCDPAHPACVTGLICCAICRIGPDAGQICGAPTCAVPIDTGNQLLCPAGA
jgi:hypothetical protein